MAPVTERVRLITSLALGFGLAGLLLGVGLFVNTKRPEGDAKPTAVEVEATGKCAECHVNVTKGVIEHYKKSKHVRANVTCFDCHKPQSGQETLDHNGFVLAKHLTSKNCSSCHPDQYRQYATSRHAAPSWAAVHGDAKATPPVPPHPLLVLEGEAATKAGCDTCHAIGRPNADGSFGQCTECHSRHDASVSLARQPQTCGQCHMGPDHSQIEIYTESKHGVLYEAGKEHMNLAADPKELKVKDMPVPTCATCHMSGLEGAGVTHDVSSRLSFYLFAPVSEKRPNGDVGRANMQMICFNCHAPSRVLGFYATADQVVQDTNAKVKEAMALYEKVKAKNPGPKFQTKLDFIAFDLWHYYGRTAKHGAFMGGADFVQWHGNYEILHLTQELKEMDK